MRARLLQLAPWAPAILAVVYLVALVVSQGTVRDSLNSHADYASAPVLAQLLSDAPPGTTIKLGDYHWYEALWLLRATIWLPAHHFVWQLVPFALWLATAGLVAGSLRVSGGSRWAAATGAALVICAGVATRGALWSLTTHGPAAFHVALVGFTLTWWAARPAWRRVPRGWGSALALGAVTALGATDPLVIACGLLPLVVAAALTWWRRGPAGPLALAAFVAVLGVAGSVWLDAIAKAAHYDWTHRKIAFIAADGVIEQLERIPVMVARIVSSSPFGEAIGISSVIAMAGAVLGLATIAVVLRGALRTGFGGVPARPRGELEPLDPGGVLATFWGLVLAANLLIVLLTSAAFEEQGARYLMSAWIAVAVLVPLLAERTGHRTAAALVATGLTVAATYAFIAQPAPAVGKPFFSERAAAQIRDYAASQDVTYGYAGFWEAMPITWHTRFAVKTYPIYSCHPPGEPRNTCWFYQHWLSSWYAEKPGRSMVVINADGVLQPQLDPSWGAPIATRSFGAVTVYVFPRDVTGSIRAPGQ